MAKIIWLLCALPVMAALLVCCGTYIEKLRRDRKNTSRRKRTTAPYYDSRTAYDGRVIGTAIVPMGILLLLTRLCAGVFDSIVFTALFFLINGIILYVPEHLPHGNKDARKMAGLDAMGIGLFAGLSVVLLILFLQYNRLIFAPIMAVAIPPAKSRGR